MKNDYRQLKLHELFRQINLEFGEDALAESRLKGLLSDMGGDAVYRYRNIIARSVSCQIGQKLLDMRGLEDADYNLKLSNLRQSFQEENFFRHDIADYIIDCYLFGFEWTDDISEYDADSAETGSARAGELSFAEHSGSDYCGNISEAGERSGFGIAKDSDSNYYAGEWRLNMKNGIGIDVSSDRQKYAGEWRLNRRAGVGVEIEPDGDRYAGEWKNGRINGCGTIYYPNGEKMCTTFCNGEPEPGAAGIYYLKDGSCVAGRMTAAGPDGRCIRYRRDGSSEEEMWENGEVKRQ